MIWAFVWNTFLQIALCGVMWGFNRFTRPSWTTGLLISLACIVAMAAGWMVFKDGKEVKKIEGEAPNGVKRSISSVEAPSTPVQTSATQQQPETIGSRVKQRKKGGS